MEKLIIEESGEAFSQLGRLPALAGTTPAVGSPELVPPHVFYQVFIQEGPSRASLPLVSHFRVLPVALYVIGARPSDRVDDIECVIDSQVLVHAVLYARQQSDTAVVPGSTYCCSTGSRVAASRRSTGTRNRRR